MLSNLDSVGHIKMVVPRTTETSGVSDAPTLMDEYEYVMHGKTFEVLHNEGAQILSRALITSPTAPSP